MFKMNDKVALKDHLYDKWRIANRRWQKSSRFGIFKGYMYDGSISVLFPDYFADVDVISDLSYHTLQEEDIVLESVYRSELFQLLTGGKNE